MNDIMFNLGILFTLSHGISEPLKSAIFEQLFRVIDSLEDGREIMGNTVSIKTIDGARTDVKDFDIDKALNDTDSDNNMWLQVPVENGFKLINIEQIVSITVRDTQA